MCVVQRHHSLRQFDSVALMRSTVTAASAATAVAVPPAAHTATRDVIFIQPSPKGTMSAAERDPERPEHHQEYNDRPLRLRGGCIPCPVGRMVLHYPVPMSVMLLIINTNDCSRRTAFESAIC
ncbi:hypothetical protein V8B97DRAFT_1483667 [Scleroderma yunnanense]